MSEPEYFRKLILTQHNGSHWPRTGGKCFQHSVTEFMGRFRPSYEVEEDEATSALGACAERAASEHVASAKWTTRRGLVVLPILAALTGIRGVSAQTGLETPRDLCIQAIQTAIVNRTRDLFQDIYLTNQHQVCLRYICTQIHL